MQESDKHGSLFAKLEKWVAARSEYLKEREVVTSTNEASYQITKLDAFAEESKVRNYIRFGVLGTLVYYDPPRHVAVFLLNDCLVAVSVAVKTL